MLISVLKPSHASGVVIESLFFLLSGAVLLFNIKVHLFTIYLHGLHLVYQVYDGLLH